jgi:hypothetical protein
VRRTVISGLHVPRLSGCARNVQIAAPQDQFPAAGKVTSDAMKTATLAIVTTLCAMAIVAIPAEPGNNSDHQEMLARLGITSPLRAGPAGRLNADGSAPPNYANYDESKATARSPVPPLLVMKNGRRITKPAQWEQHRKDLFEIFDREFYGRLPKAARTIKVTWEVTATTQGMSGDTPVITRTLAGHVDPTYYPAIRVDIAASVTTPAAAAGKVPVIIQWGGGGGARGPAAWQQTAISRGWGYGNLNPASIQADSGANNQLRQGIIGLINKGEARKVDDWGALRAWAWGASRLMDFFAKDSLVDAKQVAFEGHSRYGKATLVTLVYEPRVFTGFVSSSGEGGAKLWRHLVGEQVETLAGTGEYHWMTPNFMKYAGPLTVDDLPADAHQFIALIAPRPVFVSGGEYVEFNGDGHPGSRYSGESWQDTPGTFMATAGASPVWKLLGKKPLANIALGLRFDDVPDPIAVKARMPPPLTPLIDGDIAFRQHDQGHTDAPNWPTFIEFCGRYFTSPGFRKD